MGKHNSALLALFMAFALTQGADLHAQSSSGAAKPAGSTVVAKRELRLTTVTQINGKFVGQRSRAVCVPVTGGFAPHYLIDHDPKDTPCALVQAPSGAGSFYRFSCDNGATTIGGSIRQLTDEGFVSSYVESNSNGQISKGTVGKLESDCN